jgi:hypothetical protein
VADFHISQVTVVSHNPNINKYSSNAPDASSVAIPSRVGTVVSAHCLPNNSTIKLHPNIKLHPRPPGRRSLLGERPKIKINLYYGGGTVRYTKTSPHLWHITSPRSYAFLHPRQARRVRLGPSPLRNVTNFRSHEALTGTAFTDKRRLPAEQSPPPPNWEAAAATLSAMQHLHQLANDIVGAHPDALPLFDARHSSHQPSHAPFPWVTSAPGEFPYGLVRKALDQDSGGNAVSPPTDDSVNEISTRITANCTSGSLVEHNSTPGIEEGVVVLGNASNRANGAGRNSLPICDKAQLSIYTKAPLGRNPMSEKENYGRV